MEQNYYTINEQTARTAKHINSLDDYVAGSATAEYKKYVDRIYAVVDQIKERKPHLTEKAVKMADRYSRKLAEYYNNYYRNEASCPSVMISGPANFPVRKKEKQNRRREKLMKDWEYLQSYAGKIEYLLTMEQPILSGDENAVMLLEEKLKKLESDQAMMKAVNAYYRKNQTLEGCPELTPEQTERLKKEMGRDFHYENKPFMTYQLTNQNATIRNTRFRLEQLKKEKDAGTTERENCFFQMVENKELMRLQLIFDGKPEPEVREILKTHGFKWSPKNGCWQRQLTGNARYAVRRVLQALEKMEAAGTEADEAVNIS
ncbi:MAG: hypothetical protein KZY87_07875 [Lachnospiraceae bacterium]|nr:hypothetical protein [Lachnospiraceae bacterium]